MISSPVHEPVRPVNVPTIVEPVASTSTTLVGASSKPVGRRVGRKPQGKTREILHKELLRHEIEKVKLEKRKLARQIVKINLQIKLLSKNQ